MFSVKPSVRQGSLWNTFIPDFLLLKAADTQASPVFQHPPAWQEFCPGFELLLSFPYTLCKWIMIPLSKLPYQSSGLDTSGQYLLMTAASKCSREAAPTPADWVGRAQEWRKWKFLLSFRTPSLCKELHTSGKALHLHKWKPGLSLFLPSPWQTFYQSLTSSGLGVASSQGLLTGTSPLYSNRDKKNAAQQIPLVTSGLFPPGVFPSDIFPRPVEQHLSWGEAAVNGAISSPFHGLWRVHVSLISSLSSTVSCFISFIVADLCAVKACSPAHKALQQQLLLN